MTDAVFFRLLHEKNRATALQDAVESLREGGDPPAAHPVDPASFGQIPSSPFAYWVSEEMRRKFAELPSVESDGRTVRIGASTKDDFRWLRLWWECTYASESQRWMPLAKGGEWGTYYSPLHLVVDWRQSGDYLGEWVYQYRPREGRRWGSKGINAKFYCLPGITWPRRTQGGLSVRVFPQGCIFADKGPVIFSDSEQLSSLLAITNSKAFRSFVELQMTFGSYEAGVIQRTPVPDLSGPEAERLGELALGCVDIKRGLDTADETSHAFTLPALLQVGGEALSERLAGWRERVSGAKRELVESQREIDGTSFQLYGIPEEDRREIEAEDREIHAGATLCKSDLAVDLLSYAVGCVLGRWDARIAMDSSLAPKLADPFARLPVCPPGMLVGPDGLPARRDGIASEEWMRARPDTITPPLEDSVQPATIPNSEYPLGVNWNGVLVDDPDHPNDIVRRVRDVLELVWGERADDVEVEACDLLGVKDLRTYFRNPRQFFEHHIGLYSKSRRKAPIYWLLQSPKRSYGLWLYYYRLDPDILFKTLQQYVEPKIRLEEGRLAEHEARRKEVGTGGREARQTEEAVAKQEELLADLREFRDRLERAAKLHLHPDLNDGVELNIAPLHEVVLWKEAKSRWNELLAGKYEWSSIGKQLREKGLV